MNNIFQMYNWEICDVTLVWQGPLLWLWCMCGGVKRSGNSCDVIYGLPQNAMWKKMKIIVENVIDSLDLSLTLYFLYVFTMSSVHCV